jgi:aspartyl-tRNA(Asn)/glutamyl-tRNA(Gln) amidotransferase subunit C
MALTLEELKHVAKLARLELPDERLSELTRHINALMTHFERLNALPTENIEPTSHSIPIYNVFREDEVAPCLPREQALSAAPEARDGLFIVPRIVEEGE